MFVISLYYSRVYSIFDSEGIGEIKFTFIIVKFKFGFLFWRRFCEDGIPLDRDLIHALNSHDINMTLTRGDQTFNNS